MQFRELFGLAPANRDHIPAFRIAFGVAIPLLILLATHRLDLAIYATFGAFTGIYARHESPQARFFKQSLAGALLTMCVTVGATLSWFAAGPWIVMLVTSVLSSFTAMMAARFALVPPGSVFFIFATAAVGSVHGGVHPGLAFLIAAASAAFCVVLGLGAHLIGEGRGIPELPTPAPLSTKEIRSHGLRFLIAPLIAGTIGILSVQGIPGLSHSYWAMVAAVAPITPPRHRDRFVRSLHRIFGSFGGVMLAGFLLSFPIDPWQFVVWIIILQFLGELYIARNYALALLFITPVALMMTQIAAPVDVPDLLLARFVETVIGATVAIGVVAFGYSAENPEKFPFTRLRKT
ncbi:MULTISPECIES: FUSC family protein [Corynebacterium]|uniref:FUSC family protein n=1 Tax=Corynebacterium TaxID=1716 RepID=UPI00135A0319|nr:MULTISPECIES: FUSC family protein [Corynebacterium]MBF0581101.1 FUSC family protein [Corynebacterium sp. ED61]